MKKFSIILFLLILIPHLAFAGSSGGLDAGSKLTTFPSKSISVIGNESSQTNYIWDLSLSISAKGYSTNSFPALLQNGGFEEGNPPTYWTSVNSPATWERLAPTGTDVNIDYYSESNYDAQVTLHSGGMTPRTAVGQSFTGDGNPLNTAKFYLSKFGSPTGNAYAKVYAETHATAFGTDSLPNGAAIATSDAFDVSTLTGSYQVTSIPFSTPTTPANGSKYVLTLEYSGGDGDNMVNVGLDNSSPTHAGNYCAFTTSWSAFSTADLIFYAVHTGTDAHEGEYVGHINVSSAGYAGFYQAVSLNAGTTYRIKWWGKLLSSASQAIYVSVGALYAQPISHTIGTWTYHAFDVTPSSSGSYNLAFRSNNEISEFYIDDVSIEIPEPGSSTSFSAAGGIGATATRYHPDLIATNKLTTFPSSSLQSKSLINEGASGGTQVASLALGVSAIARTGKPETYYSSVLLNVGDIVHGGRPIERVSVSLSALTSQISFTRNTFPKNIPLGLTSALSSFLRWNQSFDYSVNFAVANGFRTWTYIPNIFFFIGIPR